MALRKYLCCCFETAGRKTSVANRSSTLPPANEGPDSPITLEATQKNDPPKEAAVMPPQSVEQGSHEHQTTQASPSADNTTGDRTPNATAGGKDAQEKVNGDLTERQRDAKHEEPEEMDKSVVAEEMPKLSVAEEMPKPAVAEGILEPVAAEAMPKPTAAGERPEPVVPEEIPEPVVSEEVPKPVIAEIEASSHAASAVASVAMAPNVTSDKCETEGEAPTAGKTVEAEKSVTESSAAPPLDNKAHVDDRQILEPATRGEETEMEKLPIGAPTEVLDSTSPVSESQSSTSDDDSIETLAQKLADDLIETKAIQVFRTRMPDVNMPPKSFFHILGAELDTLSTGPLYAELLEVIFNALEGSEAKDITGLNESDLTRAKGLASRIAVEAFLAVEREKPSVYCQSKEV